MDWLPVIFLWKKGTANATILDSDRHRSLDHLASTGYQGWPRYHCQKRSRTEGRYLAGWGCDFRRESPRIPTMKPFTSALSTGVPTATNSCALAKMDNWPASGISVARRFSD